MQAITARAIVTDPPVHLQKRTEAALAYLSMNSTGRKSELCHRSVMHKELQHLDATTLFAQEPFPSRPGAFVHSGLSIRSILRLRRRLDVYVR